jgi:hypothetical protein
VADWVIREDGEDLSLATRRVRQYERRSPTGKPEVVRSYSAQRAWWIPHPDWLKGQQEWIAAGEAKWDARGAAARAEGEAGRGGEADREAGQVAGQPGRARDSADRTLARRPEHGYVRPDPDRHVRTRGTYKRPEDHPFFKKNKLSAANIIKGYDNSTLAERYQGMRWYEDAHRLAWALGGGDVMKGAAMLSAYSPQTGWPVNIFNAARHLADGKIEGKVMATKAMRRSAARIMAGEHPEDVLKSPKTNAFGRLIALGRDHPDDELGQVVVDRHAMSVAAGRRLMKDDVGGKGENATPIGSDPFYAYVADMYREAAYQISQREGEEISPHQLQAITWLQQQRLNAAEDAAQGKGKGQLTSMRNGWAAWEQYARDHGIRTELATTAAAPVPITAAEARGNSRPVDVEEFHSLAQEGRDMLAQMRAESSPVTGLVSNWASLKDQAWSEVQKSWGGVTIDAHSGEVLPQGADKFALTVKPPGIGSISVPEGATEKQFARAMDRALTQFRTLLEASSSYLGVFHDDDTGRIDIDPVTVVDTQEEAEKIGAYSHNIGGAYHFASGNGFWPPHIQGE